MSSNALRLKFIVVAVASTLALAACAKKHETEMTSTAPMRTSETTTNTGTSQLPYDPGSQADFEANAGSRIYFAYDDYSIDDRAQATLNKQAAWLRKWPNKSVTVEGHCDERGTREYNLALGARRAESAKRFLVGLGIEEGRINTISYGKERPEVVGSNESAWAQNRRDVTVVQ